MKFNLTDELINESIAQYENDGYNDLSDNEVMKALYELQQRRTADKNCFMYGIATPEGGAYLEEFCVSSDRGLMEDEAEALNDTFETDGYRVVALHAALPLTDSERAELQQYRKAAVNPVLNMQFKNGWPVEDTIGVLVDALALPDGYHNLYAAPQLPADAERAELQQYRELYHTQEKRLFKLAKRIKGAAFDKYSHSSSQAIDALEVAAFGEGDACSAAITAVGTEPQGRGHAHTDFMMPPRISNIELRSPLEVEDICRAALRNMFARAGLRLHDHN